MSRAINLDKKLEYKGYWYLPSSPEKKVAGILTYSPNDEIILELIGCFDESLSSLFEQQEEMVIHGKTSDAKEITLLQCYQSASMNFSADFPIVKYNCNFIVIGKHINSLEEKGKYWVSFKIPELKYWCYPAALNYSMEFDKNNDNISQTTISFNSTQGNDDNIISNVQIDNNTSLLLKKGVNFETSNLLLNPLFEQYTYVEIIKQSETTIKELFSDVRKYEQFISLATFNIVESTDITLFDKDIFQECKSKKYYKDINLIHRDNKLKNEGRQRRNRDFLFQYSTIKDVYPEIIQNWYNVPKELYPIRHHLINSLEKKSSYSSVDFLIIIQAIEGFWWRFRDNNYKIKNAIPKKKNTSLNEILNELLKEFDDIELLNKFGIDIEAVVDSRHYYSHFVEQTKKPKKLDGWFLIKEAKKLRILLICCVLSFVGFEHSKIDAIFKKSNSKLI